MNKHDKSSRSPGPSCKFWAEAKLNNTVYFVYTWLAVCTVQLINTWRQAGLSKVFVDYSETWCYSLIYWVLTTAIRRRKEKNKNKLQGILFLLLIFSFLVRDGLYTHSCLVLSGFCLSGVPRFQNSQRNLYWGQPGARYWSAVQYKQLARCTQSTQCRSAWPHPRICMRVPDSCSISRAC